MKEYIVNMYEIWTQPISVKADSIEEAVDQVADGMGAFLEDEREFSHTLDRKTWSVEVDDETYYNKDGRWVK